MSLYIFGAGGVGRETATCARHQGVDIRAFVDDHVTDSVLGIDTIGSDAVPDGAAIVIAIADPARRSAIAESLSSRRPVWTSVIDPMTTWLDSCTIGAGSVILPRVHISVSAVIGEHVQIHYGATIGHDSIIGRASTVLPGAHVAGNVTIEPTVLIGSGAVILQGLRIGSGAVVGAGAVVTSDVAPGVTVVGVPARTFSR